MRFHGLQRTVPTALLVGGLAIGCSQESRKVKHWAYFGTGASHIYVSAFDAETGDLSQPRGAVRVGRPGFLAIHPDGEILYAVGRESEAGAAPSGFAAAYEIDRSSGGLSELNRAPTAGRGASHVSVNQAATALVAVNYGDGNTVSLTLRPDGQLGKLVSDMHHEGSSIHPQRQNQPHPHSANFTPDGRLVIVPDLGTDELVAYGIDPETAQLENRPDSQVRMEPGSGPRHMTFHTSGRWAYVINELASTVTVLEYESDSGVLKALQTISTLPAGYDGPANTTAEVLVHPNGRFLYGSNRGSNTIAVFSIDMSDGRLAPVERAPTGGDWPRNFRLSPDGQFLLVANQRSDDVHVFRVDSDDGRLNPTGARISVPQPMCVRFVAAL
jgi:6-phosphogluconolactonase